MARFTAPADRLLIENSLIIQQYDQEPLDYLVENYAVSSLFASAPEDCFLHVASLLAGPGSHAGTSAPWMSTIWQPGEAVESYDLLQRLSLAIHELISYRQREEPGVQTSAETRISAS